MQVLSQAWWRREGRDKMNRKNLTPLPNFGGEERRMARGGERRGVRQERRGREESRGEVETGEKREGKKEEGYETGKKGRGESRGEVRI